MSIYGVAVHRMCMLTAVWIGVWLVNVWAAVHANSFSRVKPMSNVSPIIIARFEQHCCQVRETTSRRCDTSNVRSGCKSPERSHALFFICAGSTPRNDSANRPRSVRSDRIERPTVIKCTHVNLNPTCCHAQLPGVWYFCLPQKLRNEHDSFLNHSKRPLAIWIYEDGRVLCPEWNGSGSATISGCSDSTVDSSPCSSFKLMLHCATSKPKTIEMRGLFAWSVNPSVEIWNGRVRLHAAVAIGVIFSEDKGGGSERNGIGVPESVVVKDDSGQILVDGSRVEGPIGDLIQRNLQRRIGNFAAYRIIGEDRSKLGIQHPLTEFGPSRMYNIVYPDDDDVARAVFGISSPLTLRIRGKQLLCGVLNEEKLDLINDYVNTIEKPFADDQ